jgi:lysozyme
MQNQSEMNLPDAKLCTVGKERNPSMSNFSYSDAGFALTKKFEGLRLTAYQDQVGVWTIGYGHTGREVHGGMAITADHADLLLHSDIASAVVCINRAVTADITQCHFDALVDFVFNLGCARLLGSTLLRHVNAKEFDLAAPQFLLWDHAGGVVVPGLLTRRQAEVALFQALGTP